MILTFDNTNIPDWLKPNMKMFCDCGGVMVDDGPIDWDGTMKLTQRWCSNPICPYHMAEKIQLLAKYFDVVGVGPETALSLAKGYHFRNHLQALEFWLPVKPEVYLYEVAELSYIYGVESKWKDWLAGYNSFDSYFREDPHPAPVAVANRAYLEECATYFRIKTDTINRSVLRVMLTGSMHGFSSRGEFLACINETYKDYFRVEDNKKTIRGTFCLIKEPESVDYSKTQIALNNDIPIYTSSKFLKLLEMMKEELDREDSGVCG